MERALFLKQCMMVIYCFSRNNQTVQRSKEFSKTLGKNYSGEIGDRYKLSTKFPIDEDKKVVSDFICKLIKKLIESNY